MIASRRVVALTSRRLVAATSPLSARLLSTEASSPSSSPNTSTTSSSTTAFKPKTTSPAPPAPKFVKPKSIGPQPPSDTIYHPSTIAYDAPSPPPSQQYDAIDGETEFPAVNWAASFHGVSARPVTEAQFKVLMQPIGDRDIEVKPDGVIYLPEIKYRRRLNEAFGPMGWGMIPRGEPVVGNAIVTREYALIVDGRFVSQAQGENSYFGPDQLPSAVEGCKSNAIMRCCKDLGIASELWDPHFIRWFKKTNMEEVWVEHTTTKKKRTFWYRKGAVDVAYPYKLAK